MLGSGLRGLEARKLGSWEGENITGQSAEGMGHPPSPTGYGETSSDQKLGSREIGKM